MNAVFANVIIVLVWNLIVLFTCKSHKEKFFNENKKLHSILAFENNSFYSKIKIKKEISIAYTSSENILFVAINDNQINIIDTENIHSETYFNNSITGYGGNSVSLKASEYDSSNGTLNDITSDVVKNQNEKISARKEINDRKSEIRDQLTSVLFPIGFIIISVCIAILLGKLVDKFVKSLKNKF